MALHMKTSLGLDKIGIPWPSDMQFGPTRSSESCASLKRTEGVVGELRSPTVGAHLVGLMHWHQAFLLNCFDLIFFRACISFLKHKSFDKQSRRIYKIIMRIKHSKCEWILCFWFGIACKVALSSEDEWGTMFETSIPQRLISGPTQNTHGVTASF